MNPALQALGLLLPADLQPVLDQVDPGVDHHLLDHRSQFQEALRLLRGAETHDPFHAGPVVPAAVEDHDLAGGREVGDVALNVQLGLLTLRRRGQGDDPEYTRADAFGQSLDGSALAGRITALEYDADTGSGLFDPVLQRHELDLQTSQLLLVLLAFHPLAADGGFRCRIAELFRRLKMTLPTHAGQTATAVCRVARPRCVPLSGRR